MARIWGADGRAAHCTFVDSETALACPGMGAPPDVCWTFWGLGEPPPSVAHRQGDERLLLRPSQPEVMQDVVERHGGAWEAMAIGELGRAIFTEELETEGRVIGLQNAAYDFGVAAVAELARERPDLAGDLYRPIVDGEEDPEVWEGQIRTEIGLTRFWRALHGAFDREEVTDTYVVESQIRIADGTFKLGEKEIPRSLKALVKRWFKVDLAEDKGRACKACRGGWVLDGFIWRRCSKCEGLVGLAPNPCKTCRSEPDPTRGVCPTCHDAPRRVPWRYRYDELRGVLPRDYPTAAREYAIGDPRWTGLVRLAQAGPPGEVKTAARRWPVVFADGAVVDEARQTEAAWDLHLGSLRGLHTSREMVDAWEDELAPVIARRDSIGRELGIIRDPENVEWRVSRFGEKERRGKVGTECRAALTWRVERAYEALGKPAPRSDSGAVSYSEQTLLESEDPDLVAFAEGAKAYKAYTSHLPILRAGVARPITYRVDPIKVTSRVSVSNPPWQQAPKGGLFRRSVIPAAGFLLAASDLGKAELCAWSQLCIDMFGRSEMAEKLRRGPDVHSELGAQIIAPALDEELAKLQQPQTQDTRRELLDRVRKQKGHPLAKKAKKARDTGKIGNFGRLGGLTAESMAANCKRMGLDATVDDCREMFAAWERVWPEGPRYFRRIEGMFGSRRQVTVIQMGGGTPRGSCRVNQAKNTGFQHPVALVVKTMLPWLVRECYSPDGGHKLGWVEVERYPGKEPRRVMTAVADGSRSPLYGSHPALMIHDEILCHIREGASPREASEAALRLRWLLQVAMAHLFPDLVPEPGIYPNDLPSSDVALMREWLKDADEVYDDEGVLLVWDPSEDPLAKRQALEERAAWEAEWEEGIASVKVVGFDDATCPLCGCEGDAEGICVECGSGYRDYWERFAIAHRDQPVDNGSNSPTLNSAHNTEPPCPPPTTPRCLPTTAPTAPAASTPPAPPASSGPATPPPPSGPPRATTTSLLWQAAC